MARLDVGQHSGDRARVADVERERFTVTAQRGGRLGEPRSGAPDDHDVRAGLCQAPRAGPADAARPARDERNFSR